jgi:aspartyl-tRNA(Asn)/glutamyl-tRNA(Gln) amidotransferase subunit A
MFKLTATEIQSGLDAGEFSAEEVARAYLERISQVDDRVGAFLAVDPDLTLSAARQSDHRRRQGTPRGPLDGIPVAVKDVLCTAGRHTTCASKMLEHFQPPYESTVTARLQSAGAIVLGKTNMDEFAMGGSTENSALGTTRNPWNLDLVPGGSSGGSAACLAAAMAPLSIGSDTGGSIRQPAAYCGVVGLKPTYGRVSRYGLVAFASSLDQVGPMARTAEDAALLLQAIAGHDPLDSTSADLPVPDYHASIREPLQNFRLGVVREHFGQGLEADVAAAIEDAIQIFRSCGATIHDVKMPHSKYGVATYYIIAPCEASSNLARYDGAHYGFRVDPQPEDSDSEDEEGPLVRMYSRTRARGFGPEVKRRIMLGTYALSAGYYDAYYLKALKVRRLIRNDYDAAFQQVDALIGPTTPSVAFRTGDKVDDPLAMYLQDLYTVTGNLAGVTGISIPCGQTTAGLPIGVQLQAPPFHEDRLLRAAHLFQQQTDWHTRLPELP